jgi:hypothetical protein
LFIPRDFHDLAGTTPERVADEARKREVRRIAALRRHYSDNSEDNDRGIIGRRRGEDTRQLPSTLYWGLLRRLDIVRGPAGASRSDLFAAAARATVDAKWSAAFRTEDDLETELDPTWREMPAEATDQGFSLSGEEADWLAQRFCDAERLVEPDRQSLIHWLLTESRADPVGALERLRDADRPWEHQARSSMPAATRHVVSLGSDLNRVAYGARILYNYLCATGMPATAPEREEYLARHGESMEKWVAEFRADPVTLQTMEALNEWAGSELERRRAPGASKTRWRLAHRFLSDWRILAGSSVDLLKSDEAARLVTQREALLKPGRARISNTELLRTWEGESGLLNFDFNWEVARRVVGDVCEGLAADA